MTALVGLALIALACFGFASEALDDSPRHETAPEGNRAADAMLFALCLVSVLHAHRKATEDDEF